MFIKCLNFAALRTLNWVGRLHRNNRNNQINIYSALSRDVPSCAATTQFEPLAQQAERPQLPFSHCLTQSSWFCMVVVKPVQWSWSRHVSFLFHASLTQVLYGYGSRSKHKMVSVSAFSFHGPLRQRSMLSTLIIKQNIFPVEVT